MTTVKIIAFIIQTFVGKVCHSFPSKKQLSSPSTVILEPEKKKCVPASTFPPSIFHEVMGLDAITLVFFMFSFKLAF